MWWAMREAEPLPEPIDDEEVGDLANARLHRRQPDQFPVEPLEDLVAVGFLLLGLDIDDVVVVGAGSAPALPSLRSPSALPLLPSGWAWRNRLGCSFAANRMRLGQQSPKGLAARRTRYRLDDGEPSWQLGRGQAISGEGPPRPRWG